MPGGIMFPQLLEDSLSQVYHWLKLAKVHFQETKSNSYLMWPSMTCQQWWFKIQSIRGSFWKMALQVERAQPLQKELTTFKRNNWRGPKGMLMSCRIMLVLNRWWRDQGILNFFRPTNLQSTKCQKPQERMFRAKNQKIQKGEEQRRIMKLQKMCYKELCQKLREFFKTMRMYLMYFTLKYSLLDLLNQHRILIWIVILLQ